MIAPEHCIGHNIGMASPKHRKIARYLVYLFIVLTGIQLHSKNYWWAALNGALAIFELYLSIPKPWDDKPNVADKESAAESKK